MTGLLPRQTTSMVIEQTFLAKDHVPQSLIDEYLERNKALSTTLEAITDVIKSSEAYRLLKNVQHMERAASDSGALMFKVRHRAQVEGSYQKTRGLANAELGQGFIEASTLNLLLSTKLLTDEEKRAVLKARNLLPAVEAGDENSEEKENTDV